MMVATVLRWWESSIPPQYAAVAGLSGIRGLVNVNGHVNVNETIRHQKPGTALLP